VCETTPYNMKRVIDAELPDKKHVVYAVIENPPLQEFKTLFYEMGGDWVMKYGYTIRDVYDITSGNLIAAKYVVKYADDGSLCDRLLCLRNFSRKFFA